MSLPIVLGVALVLVAIAFVLLPLFQRTRPEHLVDSDPSTIRAGLYQQIIDAELDARLGKLTEADFAELRSALLARAAALIELETGAIEQPLDVETLVEAEVAAARAALRTQSYPSGLHAL